LYKNKKYIIGKLVEVVLRYLDKRTVEYITSQGNSIADLLLDYIALEKELKDDLFVGEMQYDGVTGRYRGQPSLPASETYHDYSFLAAPAYKAFEGYLYLLAESLGLKTREQIIKAIGSIYDPEYILQLKREIITETNAKLSANDKELQGILTELKRVLELYRHSPAHFLGERIDSLEKAEGYAKTVLTVINQTTKTLLDRGYISI
jgi:hypothetical protein